MTGDAAHTTDLGDLLRFIEGLGLLEERGAVREALEGLGDLLLLVEGLGLLEERGAVREALEGLGDLLLLVEGLGLLEERGAVRKTDDRLHVHGASAGVVLHCEGTLAVRADHGCDVRVVSC